MDYFRFHRSLRILPGLRLNLGKRSMSICVGVKAAHTNFGSTGKRTTVGIIGTGISYMTAHHTAAGPQGSAHSPAARSIAAGARVAWLAVVCLHRGGGRGGDNSYAEIRTVAHGPPS